MEALKRFVNTPDLHQAFNKYIEGKIELARKSLEQSGDPVEIYRSQGKILALRKLLTMRDEVNSG